MTHRRATSQFLPQAGSALPDASEGAAAIVAGLQAVTAIQDLSYTGLKTVAAIRLLALCGPAGRDPLLELTHRFGCLTAAKAFLQFADLAGSYWPEKIKVLRPCCRAVSPDELVLAQIADAARDGNRAQLSEVLAGFVRRERHDRLFDSAAAMVSLVQ